MATDSTNNHNEGINEIGQADGAIPEGVASQMPFLEHLAELRTRLMRIAIGIGVGFAVCYGLIEPIYDLLLEPLKLALPDGYAPIGTGIAEAFLSKLKIALLAGVMVASPWVFYQVWLFVSPGLYPKEKRWVIPIVLFASIFFGSGVVFGYVFVFPVSFQFLLEEFSSIEVDPQIRISEYFTFAAKMLLAFGIAFELPIVAFFLGRLGLIDVHFLVSKGKYAVLIIFVFAAMLTPPDFVSQIFLAVPLIILYGLSIGLVAVFGKKRREPEAENVE